MQTIACGTLMIASLVAAACSSDPPLSNATALDCPNPGALPFHLDSSGFQHSGNADVVANDPRDKDEASDAFGNVGGTSANVYIDDSASPGAGLASYHGRKARTITNSGLTATPIPGEYVSLWYYDAVAAKWTTLGRTATDDSGYYDIAATSAPVSGSPIYAVLEADRTCAKHYDALLPSGADVVVSDIDGTLTTSDAEFITQIGDGAYQPAMMTDANVLMQTWNGKKYPIVYLTARGHLYFSETRAWLDALSFPPGTVITSNTLLANDTATETYKANWLARIVHDFGWNVVAAYGNAITDIQAYQSVGIPNDRIFIVGPNGGQMGTTAIANDDYTPHVAGFVASQPEAP